ncbi:MAG: phosphoenolpyruvate carboxylase [Candidatus Helarchaeota archaeon]
MKRKNGEQKMVKVPKCMSTQHPDNVASPFFARDAILEGEDEIKEAYYSFSHLGCDEQMWDCEGKEVDNYVVKKLLTRYRNFFIEKKLGEDIFLTLRVPNPSIEKSDAKILLETLESIPRSFDIAKIFYKEEIAPIFEVILPMTTDYKSLNRVYWYYRDYVVGKQEKKFRDEGVKIAEWIGNFLPEKINVIPLYEDMEHMLEADVITREYIKGKELFYQRVFLARSDPAMNYGLISAVLLNKIALNRLERISKETGVKIYPIVGVGSAPFRGNLKPETVERIIKEYPSVYTFTIQSSFKYDYSPEEVMSGIKKIKNKSVKRANEIEEEKCLEIIEKYSKEYQRQVLGLALIMNKVAKYIPNRRKRKLHIGLFGYSRGLEIGDRRITLPRAIKFTTSLYSIGVPPEILGLNILGVEDFHFLKKVYINIEEDLRDALRYYNSDSPFLPKEVKKFIKEYPLDFEINKEHKRVTDQIISIIKRDNMEYLEEFILQAANIRRFLG